MANRTVKDAHTIRGTNPQYLVEKIIRSRVYECKYWKEECFALTAELLVDKAMELKYIGGVVGGNIRPTPFVCLILKMLQIQPEKDIVVEFIKNEDFKYVRALGAFYMRLTGTALDCYKYLEPLYNDYRKIRKQNREGTFILTHVDEFVEELLSEERALDVILPRIQKRTVLEENNELETRVSALEEDLDAIVESGSEEEDFYMEASKQAEPTPTEVPEKRKEREHRERGRSRSPGREHHRREKKRRPSRERGDRLRHRSRSPREIREVRDRGERERPERPERLERPERPDRPDRPDRPERPDRPDRPERPERDRGRGRREDVRNDGRNDERRAGGGGRRERDYREEKREKDKGRGGGRGGGKGEDMELDDDIKEANELRAKLGLPPLRP